MPNFLSGGAGADTILGGPGDDKIAGNFTESLTDSLRGEDGNDQLAMYDNVRDLFSLGAGIYQFAERDSLDVAI
jgi:Ca2+-binding RTX toxin-like protein